MPGRGMHGRAGHGMRDPIARLLDHQTLLHLTPAEVNSIIGIDDKLHNDNKPLIERLMAMRPMRGRAWGGRGHGRSGADTTAGPEGAVRARRDSAMAIIRSIRENVWRATAAADAVLTPEQLNAAGNLDPAGHRGGMMLMRSREMMPDGRGGAPRG